eukprot:scaffold1151_cov126-Isochrysis_galbana.AAC.4
MAAAAVVRCDGERWSRLTRSGASARISRCQCYRCPLPPLCRIITTPGCHDAPYHSAWRIGIWQHTARQQKEG